MRAVLMVLLAFSIFMTDALAEDVDYNKFARTERAQLAKCFTDVLRVAKRHSLREHFTAFLEASCAEEMRNYRRGLGRDPPPGLEFLSKDLQQAQFSMLLIGSMENAADRLYRQEDNQMPVCSGDACVLDAYRACLYLQIPDQISKLTKPREFENVAQQKCKVSESAARASLILDFVTVQKQQIDGELSQTTRSLIEETINEIRHKIVFSYSEDLVKRQPGRQSCKREMCGDSACVSLSGPGPDELEYECAIQD